MKAYVDQVKAKTWPKLSKKWRGYTKSIDRCDEIV